jgi:hypothetical protein
MIVNFSFKICILPFWTTHHVVVVVADDITIQARPVKQLGVVIGVVGHIADVENA